MRIKVFFRTLIWFFFLHNDNFLFASSAECDVHDMTSRQGYPLYDNVLRKDAINQLRALFNNAHMQSWSREKLALRVRKILDQSTRDPIHITINNEYHIRKKTLILWRVGITALLAVGICGILYYFLTTKSTHNNGNQASKALHPGFMPVTATSIFTPQTNQVHTQNYEDISTLTDCITRNTIFTEEDFIVEDMGASQEELFSNPWDRVVRVYRYDTELSESTEQQIIYVQNLGIDLNVVLPETSNQSFYGMEKGNRTFNQCLIDQIEYAQSIGLEPIE